MDCLGFFCAKITARWETALGAISSPFSAQRMKFCRGGRGSAVRARRLLADAFRAPASRTITDIAARCTVMLLTAVISGARKQSRGVSWVINGIAASQTVTSWIL